MRGENQLLAGFRNFKESSLMKSLLFILAFICTIASHGQSKTLLDLEYAGTEVQIWSTWAGDQVLAGGVVNFNAEIENRKLKFFIGAYALPHYVSIVTPPRLITESTTWHDVTFTVTGVHFGIGKHFAVRTNHYFRWQLALCFGTTYWDIKDRSGFWDKKALGYPSLSLDYNYTPQPEKRLVYSAGITTGVIPHTFIGNQSYFNYITTIPNLYVGVVF